MTDVFVVGALHLDVVVDAPRLPRLDETLIGSAVAYRFGGKGGNQAVAAARMGAQVAMAGRVGSDGFAAMVLAELAASGVEHAQVRTVDGATGMSVAIVENGGDYGAVVVSGVNRTIAAQEVEPGDARVILLQNEIPEAVNRAVIQRRGAGTTVVLNAAPARPTAPDLLRGVDLLVVNRVEAAQMTGEDPDALDILQAGRQLQALGPRAVVITLGADGALVMQAEGSARIRPPHRSTGSTHGAGDAFVGALAAEIARTGSLRGNLADMVTFAVRAAAHFVSVPPAVRPSITREDVENWRPGR